MTDELTRVGRCLYDAIEAQAAVYRAATNRPLRTYPAPIPSPVTPAVWLSLPSIGGGAPVWALYWGVLLAVDGDALDQTEVVYELIANVYDAVVGAKFDDRAFTIDGASPGPITVQSSTGPTNVLGYVITARIGLTARTLCPPDLTNTA